MREVVIAGYLRTAQSRSRPKDPARDVFCKMRADELLAKLLPELAKRTGIQPEEIDDFIVGCATAVGEQWAYGGRFPIFLANFPKTVAAKFVDQQCGSSMAAIHMGFLEVATNNADIVMVGGMEHMTRIPMGQSTTEGGLIAPNLALFAGSGILALGHDDNPEHGAHRSEAARSIRPDPGRYGQMGSSISPTCGKGSSRRFLRR